MLAPPLCWSCGGPARRRESLCGGCRSSLRRLGPEPALLGGVRVWAPLAYHGAARELVRALKFRGAVGVADAMAAQIVAAAPAGLLDGATVPAGAGISPLAAGTVVSPLTPGAGTSPLTAGAGVPPVLVPVPIHPRRARRRGFNQAHVLAVAIARRSGLALLDCLTRSGAPGSQVGRGRAERRAGPQGAIAARPPVPPRALLVDDVATTGATLAACAAALRAAGTRELAAVAFARAPGR